MHILADENIPFIEEAFSEWGRISRKAGRAMTSADLKEVDMLLVRSVTPVNDTLLEGSRVQFVGSATIGTDHIDGDALNRRGIAFAHAPGSNADSVVEYVLTSLLVLSVRHKTSLRGKTIGLVGCGQIGSRLARRLPAFGARVLQNDPPLAEAAEGQGQFHPYIPLQAVLDEADIVSFHTPLTRTGPHPTYHLMDAQKLARMKSGAWLVNTCRGSVVSNTALLQALKSKHLGATVLDVWAHEPRPDLDLLRHVDLATPHIAGYSFDGKVAGTVMLYEAACHHFSRSLTWNPESVLAPATPLLLKPVHTPSPESTLLADLALQAYPIAEDDARMRTLLNIPDDEIGLAFSRLRKHYPIRRTFNRYTLSSTLDNATVTRAVESGLCFRPR